MKKKINNLIAAFLVMAVGVMGIEIGRAHV